MSFTLLKERQKLNDLSLNGREASKSLVDKELRPLLIVTKTTPAQVKPGFTGPEFHVHLQRICQKAAHKKMTILL